MGCADYHPAPSVLICPLEGCKKGRRQLNGPGLVSQLYSHWQTVHKGNKAAEQLEARWRKAIKDKTLTLRDLYACAPCQMTGDADQGYEPLREASVTTRHFPHSFALGSPEYFTWLQATDEL